MSESEMIDMLAWCVLAWAAGTLIVGLIRIWYITKGKF